MHVGLLRKLLLLLLRHPQQLQQLEQQSQVEQQSWRLMLRTQEFLGDPT